MSTIGVFQCTMSLSKKTHHHRDLSTTHRTTRIQLSYSKSAAFTDTCVPTRHQREPLAWCRQTHLAGFLLGWWIGHWRVRRRWRCRCRCCNLSFLCLVAAAAIFCQAQCLCLCVRPWNGSQLTETAYECRRHCWIWTYTPWYAYHSTSLPYSSVDVCLTRCGCEPRRSFDR